MRRNACENGGVKQNASNTSVIYEGEGQPPAIAHLIFFDSEEVVPAIVRALANKRPDLYFRYEFCDEDAQYAGLFLRVQA